MVSCHRIFFTFNTKKIFHLSATFLLLLLLLSCGFKKPTIANAEFSIGKIKSSSFGPIINADEILSALTLINISTPKGFYPVKAALIIKRPSHLRLEMLPVIGVPDFFLTVSPEKMKIFIPSQVELYRGRPTVSNLQKFLPWLIEIEDMIMIFTGTHPLFKENNITYQARQEDDLLRVEMNAPSGSSQIIWLGKNNKLLKLVRKDDTGEELYNVKYTYDDDHNDFPEKIIINMADETTSLSVKYLDVKIEKTTDLSIFDLAIPENAKEIILE